MNLILFLQAKRQQRFSLLHFNNAETCSCIYLHLNDTSISKYLIFFYYVPPLTYQNNSVLAKYAFLSRNHIAKHFNISTFF